MFQLKKYQLHFRPQFPLVLLVFLTLAAIAFAGCQTLESAASVETTAVPAQTVAAEPAAPATNADAEVALAWYDLYQTLVQTSPGFSPPVASRAFGYAGVTLYEAIVPGLPGYRSLAGQLNGLQPLP